MSVYTVHEPPLRAADALADPERFVFVRDGFYAWAFLLTPLWLLWHRLWLMFVSYVVLSAVLDGALRLPRAATVGVVPVGAVMSLRHRGWRNVGVVSGHDDEDPERRFFDPWLGQPPPRSGPPSASTPSAPAAA